MADGKCDTESQRYIEIRKDAFQKLRKTETDAST